MPSDPTPKLYAGPEVTAQPVMGTILVVTLLFALVAGSFLRMVIPVVLYGWAGRLQAEEKPLAPQPGAPGV